MSSESSKNWEQHLHNDNSKDTHGTTFRSGISGKKRGELHQKYLQESQRLQRAEKKMNLQLSDQIASQSLEDVLESILRTRQQILKERSPSPERLSRIGAGIFEAELHSNKEKQKELYSEIIFRSENEKKNLELAMEKQEIAESHIEQLKKNIDTLEKRIANFRVLASNFLDSSHRQRDIIVGLQSQIEGAKSMAKYATLGAFNNNESIERLEEAKKIAEASIEYYVTEARNHFTDYNENIEKLKLEKTRLYTLQTQGREYLQAIQDSQRNITIYTNLAKSLETIPNVDLQLEKSQLTDITHTITEKPKELGKKDITVGNFPKKIDDPSTSFTDLMETDTPLSDHQNQMHTQTLDDIQASGSYFPIEANEYIIPEFTSNKSPSELEEQWNIFCEKEESSEIQSVIADTRYNAGYYKNRYKKSGQTHKETLGEYNFLRKLTLIMFQQSQNLRMKINIVSLINADKHLKLFSI